ncbi:endonuclease domain-containing protein [Bauldia litoralis]|uniref:endonuclease domain-containing protein n=1 Tax=Bauldia litoralis TaxID=665467 RepID=UPI0032995DC2
MADKQARRLRKTLTPQEARLWSHLRTWRGDGFHFRRQVPRAGYILDFACLRHNLVVEIDGGQHARFGRAAQDLKREEILVREDLRTLRFWNGDIDRNLGGVLDAIRAALQPERTPPTALRAVPPPRSGEG